MPPRQAVCEQNPKGCWNRRWMFWSDEGLVFRDLQRGHFER